MKLINIKKHFLDLLFPIKCIGCSKEFEKYICDKCIHKIPLKEAKLSLPYIDNVYSATDYNGKIISRAIKEMKYGFVKDLAEPLSKILIRYIYKNKLNYNQYIIVPIPLHKKRLNWRGFNQSELLAQNISKYFNWPIKNLLIKIKHIKPQAQIEDLKLRKENIKDSFRVVGRPSQNILLIDDVLTTGSTLIACAKILKEKGAKSITVITLAHG